MGVLSDIYDSIASLGLREADAEAPPKGGASTASPAAGSDEESGSEAEVNKADSVKGKEDDGGEGGAEEPKEDEPAKEEPEEEEEEEEDEPVDPMTAITEECEKTKECAPAKHHYDECAERVTSQTEKYGKPKEDCVEEFFHLAHCATQCAAPKLWKQLK
ncbi:Non-heme 11 kDa protein of cytochrome bc1 complex [Aulographum hederae CBS 113979]|uniref:Cytochrome b-c1 complex subunit 6, mitochondrial n=1 Tax=Aulographum hederae CBS 113979 TaxID=1176131 RepID=A0A6G1HFA1_9PEZI|nr:Non-heme 11 kDa protein of cytochrome bc1 complex [Aulographum hederae CBS 113979]